MFGRFASGLIKAATLPVDACNAALDIVTGGDGSKESRTGSDDFPNPLGMIEQIRDRVCEAAEEIDD